MLKIAESESVDQVGDPKWGQVKETNLTKI